jgi:outer membrane protein OmpA-like peptidoglycan-associated protein
MKNPVRLVTASIAAAWLASCATTPETVPELEQARAKVESLAQNPLAEQAANRDLTGARGALTQAEQALEEGEDPEVVAHLAYLASRRAELGLARIEEAQARQAIAKSEAERNEILLESRTAEARSAQQEAQASREAALQARTDLESMQQELAALQAKQTERGMVLTLGDVLFDTAEATLKEGAAETIERLADFLKRNEETRIRIEGHTDSRGSEEYNNALSMRRAETVANALAAEAVSAERVAVLGRGEGFPVASNDTPAGRQQNRRVEIIFSDPSGTFAPAAAT